MSCHNARHASTDHLYAKVVSDLAYILASIFYQIKANQIKSNLLVYDSVKAGLHIIALCFIFRRAEITHPIKNHPPL